MKIEIFLIRTNYTRWGVHGNLYINGKFLCNTCEHPLAAPSLRLPHHKLQKGARLDRQIKGYSI